MEGRLLGGATGISVGWDDGMRLGIREGLDDGPVVGCLEGSIDGLSEG